VRLRFLGHAAFDLRLADLRLCLDPHRPGALGGRFRLPAIVGPFDAMVLSHRHEDHAGWTPELGCERAIDRDTDLPGVAVRCRWVSHDDVGGLRMGLTRMVSLQGEGLRIVHCGDIGAWDASDIQWLRGCDGLLVPVGGTFTLDGPAAAALVKQVAPRWVVPMHAADERVDLPLAPIAPFIHALGWPVLNLSVIEEAPPAGSVVRLPAP
jgi:L-ascorbate metabolism protein UlaG (beta-lactamase superfamily)